MHLTLIFLFLHEYIYGLKNVSNGTENLWVWVWGIVFTSRNQRKNSVGRKIQRYPSYQLKIAKLARMDQQKYGGYAFYEKFST